MNEGRVGKIRIGEGNPLVLIAGPCVIENEEITLTTAKKLKEICDRLGISLIFKSSYDKANRTSGSSFRGLGIDQGLKILSDVKNIIEKFTSTGNQNLLITERGTSFGYNNLIVDFRGFPIIRSFGYPILFDVTHSLQLPGGQRSYSGGQREFAPPLARAAVAMGVDGLFIEVHPDPTQALSDASTMIPLQEIEGLLQQTKTIHDMMRKWEMA